MKLTDQQINWLRTHVGAIEVDYSDFDQLTTEAWTDATGLPDETVAWEAAFEEEGLRYEEVFTLGDLRTAEISDDTLKLADGRSLRFKWTRVIPWEQIDNEN